MRTSSNEKKKLDSQFNFVTVMAVPLYKWLLSRISVIMKFRKSWFLWITIAFCNANVLSTLFNDISSFCDFWLNRPV